MTEQLPDKLRAIAGELEARGMNNVGVTLRNTAEEVDCLRRVLTALVLDVQQYEAWQRPCAALDNAKSALESPRA